MLKVVLTKDVPGKGKAGDVVNVADGYARNYLFPREMAVAASQDKMKELAIRRKAREAKENKIEQKARALAARLDKLKIIVKAKQGEGGKLFGSVNNKDMADALAVQHKIKLDRKKLVVKESIKHLGVYNITAKLHPDVQVKVIVEVVGE